MPRRNRVDPWGDLIAVSARGLLTGNRGCLVDDHERVVRRQTTSHWISCTLSYRDHRVPLAAPHHWTPLFFLDEAVALAAGHRPCARCRRGAYLAFRDAVGATAAEDPPMTAADLDTRLATERRRPGSRRPSTLSRRTERHLWSQPYADLPDGTVVVIGGEPHLVLGAKLRPFTVTGWGRPVPRPATGVARVLTPPTAYAALAHGYRPLLAAPNQR